MSFTKINKVIPRIMKSCSLGQEAEAAYVCRMAQEAAGGEFESVVFKNGALTVKTKNHIKAQEIQLGSETIIKKINQILGRNLVKRLKFRS